MLSDAVLRRLAELNRESLPAVEPQRDAVDSESAVREFVVPIALTGSAFAPSTFRPTGSGVVFRGDTVIHTSHEPAKNDSRPPRQAICNVADLPPIKPIEIENDSGKHAVLRRRVSDYLPDHLFDRIDLAASSTEAPARPAGERHLLADAARMSNGNSRT